MAVAGCKVCVRLCACVCVCDTVFLRMGSWQRGKGVQYPDSLLDKAVSQSAGGVMEAPGPSP